MKKYIIILFLVILTILILLTAISNPLRKDCEIIRNNILKVTPIGSDIDYIITAIEEQGWEFEYQSDFGFRINSRDISSKKSEFVGVKHIRATLGAYINFFVTDVCAYWGFDENNKLVDVYIVKYTDGL